MTPPNGYRLITDPNHVLEVGDIFRRIDNDVWYNVNESLGHKHHIALKDFKDAIVFATPFDRRLLNKKVPTGYTMVFDLKYQFSQDDLYTNGWDFIKSATPNWQPIRPITGPLSRCRHLCICRKNGLFGDRIIPKEVFDALEV